MRSATGKDIEITSNSKVIKGGIRINRFERSQVDIIVPYHGEYQAVIKLIDSIYRCTRPPFLLTLVDDASDNIDFGGKIRKNTNINVIRNEQQLGFGRSLAVGYENTSFPWCIFINSDCQIRDYRWLNKLGECMLNHRDKGVKMISPRTNNAVGGDPRQEISNPNKIGDDIILEDSYLTLYCVMCHRKLFERINGFIKPYPYGWYEDQEIAYRMKKYGFKQGISGNTWIYHEGMRTIKNMWRTNPVSKSKMEENENRCLADLKSIGLQ